MSANIALQLYTIREYLAKDFEGGVRRIAAMGYKGIETAGFAGTTPQAAAKLFRELKLEVCSVHMDMPVGDAAKTTVETMQVLGSKRIFCGMGPDDFKTMDQIKASCGKFDQGCAAAVKNGMQFGIHNHWWEFFKVDGRYIYQIMIESLDPRVLFEIDTYWVKTAGVDPAAVVKELGPRAPVLHIKDGPAVRGQPMTAVGEGTLDFAAIAKAAGRNTEWMVVELDSCATDMFDAVKRSYAYLTSNGLAVGNK